MINLTEFIRAVEEAAGEANLTPETLIWSDLELNGDDWFYFSVHLLDLLGTDAQTDLNIYNYIPTSGEVGIFGYCDRTIPDISLRELFAFINFQPRQTVNRP